MPPQPRRTARGLIGALVPSRLAGVHGMRAGRGGAAGDGAARQMLVGRGAAPRAHGLLVAALPRIRPPLRSPCLRSCACACSSSCNSSCMCSWPRPRPCAVAFADA
eukprot:4261455-Pleurochrysis_carterae.AAC.1